MGRVRKAGEGKKQRDDELGSDGGWRTKDEEPRMRIGGW